MASFQIHEDQENFGAGNLARLKNNPSKLNAKVPQRRTVLGDINSNSNRVVTRSSKQDLKAAVNKPLKARNDFTIHEDLPLPSKGAENALLVDKSKQIVLGVKSKPPTVVSKAPEPKVEEVKETKLDLSDAVISVPRQPLKDLKVSDVVEDEEAMSESYSSSPEQVSPMSTSESLVLSSSPLLRHSKPSLQLLYDMDEYRSDIYKYLLQAEKRARPKALYMRRQPDVTYSMRSILVDWLVEVAEEYKLSTETLYLTVSYIDRFLSVMSVVKGKLQLLGTAAMFLASKYEEIYPPDVSEFVYITDDTYNKRQVLRMEQLILKVLSFDVSAPTTFAFLQHVAVDCNLSVRLTNLAQFLCELTLLEGDPYLAFMPSVIACSALAVARHCLEYEEAWPAELQESTGYSLVDLAPCVVHLNVTHSEAASHKQQAICDKYKNQKWQRVAEVTPKALRI